jgi:hypothetical protein
MFMFRLESAGRKHYINVANGFLKKSQITAKNQNYIHEETINRLGSGNACYHTVHDVLFSCLLFENVKYKMYKL